MRRALLVVISMLVSVLTHPASAASGNVDTSFDGNGMVTVGFASAAEGLEVLNDGTILLGGTYGGDLGFASLGQGGAPTTGFGTDGVATIDLGHAEQGQGLAVDGNRSMVVAGWNSVGGNLNTVIGKVDADGDPVTAFSEDGARSFDFGKGKDDRVFDVDLTSSGKIVVGGTVTVAGSRRFLLARIRKDGDKDRGFGGGDGVVKLKVGPASEIRDVLVLPNDGVLVAGYTRVGGHGNDFVVARFKPNGALDRGFSGDGRLIVGEDEGEVAESVALLPDGRIAVAGSFGRDMIVRWYTGSGIPFESAGVNGRTRIAYGTSNARAYDLVPVPQGGGRLYVVGTGATPTDVLVVKLGSDGLPVDAFGDDGRAAADFLGAESGAAGAISPTGKLLVAGQTDGFDGGRAVSGSMLVVRFDP